MPEHDPSDFASMLGAKLATRSRHVCVLFGAGAARACGLPDVATLEQGVAGNLPKKSAAAYARVFAGLDLEQGLSRLRRIHALLGEGDQTIDGLTGVEAQELDRSICQTIVAQLDLADADLAPMTRFASWVGRADYHLPVEIFTVNYDLLIETPLEALTVPYFDGFVGALHAGFRTDLVEATHNDQEWLPAFVARLWKLHGSVNWKWETERQVVRLGRVVGEDQAAAIYPSDAKYDESRRVPFVVLHDRLRRALQHPETLLLVSGYSWRDQHLNEVIFEAAQHRPRSEVIAFGHSDIPDRLRSCAERIPNLQAVAGSEAILGGIRGAWKATDSPPPELWQDGKLVLGDFRQLAGFLARSSAPTAQPGRALVDQIADSPAAGA